MAVAEQHSIALREGGAGFDLEHAGVGPERPSFARDVPLDLIRGLAMVILVINHIHLESALEHGTRALLSAAEVLVAVSGVVVGMVFGRRWLTHGARATTSMLLRRARKLYLASVVVVGLVGALSLVPGLATEILSVSPRVPGYDSYADQGGVLPTLVSILTLEAGPWQFNILGFFIVSLAVAPAVLWALHRGWWPAVMLASAGIYVAGRTSGLELLPSQSERAFPILVWQLLFVGGAVLGWHRAAVARLVRRSRGLVVRAVAMAAVAFAAVVLLGPGIPDGLYGKRELDPLRVLAMVCLTAGVYVVFTRHRALAERVLGWLLLPLGRNSFYVFIMHVFVCLAVASIPFLAGDGLGPAGNAAVQIGCLGLLLLMVRRRFLFRWVPR